MVRGMVPKVWEWTWATAELLLPRVLTPVLRSHKYFLPCSSSPFIWAFLDGGSDRAPSNEHQYSCLSSSFPESAKPLSTSILLEILRESFKSKGPLPSSPMGPLPMGPMGPLPSSPMGPIDKGYVKHFPVADLNRSQLLARQKRMLAAGMHTEQLWALQNWTRAIAMNKMGPLPLGSLPMGPMGPMDKGYVKHFPVADLHRNQLLALQNWTRATAMNKLPGISAAATSVTGCDSAHVIGMDEWKDCSAAQPTGEALMNNLL